MKANTTSSSRPMQINKRRPVVLNRDRTVISTTPVEVIHPTPEDDDPTVRSVVWSAHVLNVEHNTVEEDYPTMSDGMRLPIGSNVEDDKKEVIAAYLEKLDPLCSTDSMNLLKESIKDGTMSIDVTIRENLH